MLLALISACRTSPDDEARRSRCPTGIPCVDLAWVEPSWTTSEGWHIAGLHLGDLDGDGVVDAAVDLTSKAGDPPRASVVWGPLDRPLLLPEDQDLGFDGAAALVADLSGDGLADLVLAGDGGDSAIQPRLAVVEGPLVGQLPQVLPTGGDLRLLRRGSVVERVSYHVDPDAWLGPWPTWSTAPPDLSFRAPECQTERLTVGWLGDLDDDGASEWFLAGSREDCWLWVINGQRKGEIEPTDDDAVAWPTGVPRALGDLDGDGADDFEIGGSYVLGPLRRDTPTPEPLFELAPPLVAEPLHVDVDGDGWRDFRVAAADVSAPARAGAAPEPGRWGPAGARRHAYVRTDPARGVDPDRALFSVVHDDDVRVHHVLDAGQPRLLAYRPGPRGGRVVILPLNPWVTP